MSNLVQNQNQFAQTAMLGALTRDPQPATFPCMIDPAYVASTVITNATAVKLVAAVGPQIIVTPCTSVTDGPVFGIIIFNPQKNRYLAGDFCEVASAGNVILLKSSAAINRGDSVSNVNPTVYTNDPQVTTDATSTHQIVGVALGQVAAANLLIPVRIVPSVVA